MRSQCAVYVDAGYLLAATATRVTGTSLRSGVEVDHRALIECLIRQAEADSGLPLLRVNWYDSGSRPGGLPDYVQEQIGLTPRVKLRLGRRSLAGEQKGVDLRIGLDLATHGRQRVVDVMYLVTGDDDLTEAVEEAQGHGVQVSLLAVPNHAGRPQAVARHLQRAADEVLLIDGAALDAAVRTKAIPEVLVPAEAVTSVESVESSETAESAVPADSTAPTESAQVAQATSGSEIVEPVSTHAAAGPGSNGAAAGAVPGPRPPESRPLPSAPGALSSAPTAHAALDDVEDGAAAVDEANDSFRPKPSVLAGRKPTQVLAPKAMTSVVWSSAPGSASPWEDDEVTLEDVHQVAQQVVEGWCSVATPDMLAELRSGRPTIPGDLDRALLVDLSNRSGVYDIPDAARYALRERFWALIERAKLG